ncbi:hypothetical protein [Lacipirellula parvula]|uniref:Uncharacterized protein n=1 Tax=Lacipirellula parvula TaxID=2650471 RepID=A0A5K7X8L1_9BACT|nr:hypothetical protein [Lacipirellula parvula]BBO32980.1 hypothetical protein PLANPX_2592 [Lacipirellula parvula]
METEQRARPRYSLLTLLALGSVVALAVGWAAASGRWAAERHEILSLIPEEPLPPNDHVLKTFPVTIAISSEGSTIESNWQLSVNAAGAATLHPGVYEPAAPQSFNFTNEQQQVIRDLLVTDRFFELDDRYGDLVPDGGSKTLTVVIGDHAKSVNLAYLRWDPSDPYFNAAKVEESARALRVYLAIRDFLPPNVVPDERPYLLRALQAAEKLEANRKKQP